MGNSRLQHNIEITVWCGVSVPGNHSKLAMSQIHKKSKLGFLFVIKDTL